MMCKSLVFAPVVIWRDRCAISVTNSVKGPFEISRSKRAISDRGSFGHGKKGGSLAPLSSNDDNGLRNTEIELPIKKLQQFWHAGGIRHCRRLRLIALL